MKRIKKNEKFEEIQKEILEMKKKKRNGYVTTIAQVFDRAKKEDEKEEKNGQKNKEDDDDMDEAAIKKRYMERPAIQEAVDIAVDQVHWTQKTNLAQKK